MESSKIIASRIREIRESCNYSQVKLAKELKIDLDTYISYEENKLDIPISVIYQIAGKFGVDFADITTGTNAKLCTYHVVPRGEGRPIDRFPGYSYEDLAYNYSHKVMQPLLVTLTPSDEVHELVSHTGQEFNLVLEGTIKLIFENKEIILKEGDSVYFNSTLKHGQVCVGDKKARFLTVITN